MKKILSLLLLLLISTHTAVADGPVIAQYMTNRVMRPVTPGFTTPELYAFSNVAASATDSSIIAAVAGKKIRVLQAFALTGATATNITFNSKSGGAGTAISPLFANAANGGEVLPFSPVGWFETITGEGLTVTTGAGSSTGVLVTYITY